MAVDQPFNEIPISSVPRALRPNPSRLLNHEQSTPSITTPGQSDDSFFGFDKALNTPLPFSPVPMRPMPSPSNSEASSEFSVSSSMISPGKRKLQLRVFDVPVEKPSKKLKKKKNQKQVKLSGHFNFYLLFLLLFCFVIFRVYIFFNQQFIEFFLT